ncbi:MAG: hypothetical protein ABIA11_02750 [Patescibacteria group bacterium]
MKNKRRNTFETCKASRFFTRHHKSNKNWIDGWEIRRHGSRNIRFHRIIDVRASVERLMELTILVDGKNVVIYPGWQIDYRRGVS